MRNGKIFAFLHVLLLGRFRRWDGWMDGWMGYYPTYSPGLLAIVWLRIDGDGGFLDEVVINGAAYLLV